jgi:two-component system chemotaxis response regulator CheB
MATHGLISSPALDMIVIAGSLGGVQSLRAVLSALPADFPVPILVVQHRAVTENDALPMALGSFTGIPVHSASNGDAVSTVGVRVIPAHKSANISKTGEISLCDAADGRPADVLLASAASSYGVRACAVILSGRLDDGAAGVRAIKRRGGRVLVQEPSGAKAAGMPTAAIATGCVDFILPLRLLASALIALALAPGGAEHLMVPTPPWANLAVGGAEAFRIRPSADLNCHA